VAWVGVIDLESALVMALTLPLVPVFMWLIGRATEQRTRERWEALRRLSTHFLDVVRGLPTLRAFNRGQAQAARIADVGAGAGFPGLPLGIALSFPRMDLIESGRRKCDLIERLAMAAGVVGARAIRARAEEWGAAGAEGREAYDAVTARAVGPLVLILEYASPLLLEGGVLVAWKGARDHDEEADAAGAAGRLAMRLVEVRQVRPFPGARARHLHVYAKAGPTPPNLPRRPGLAAKRASRRPQTVRNAGVSRENVRGRSKSSDRQRG
jgi:16S rRNA (guanine527-N7)-methyltransferase